MENPYNHTLLLIDYEVLTTSFDEFESDIELDTNNIIAGNQPNSPSNMIRNLIKLIVDYSIFYNMYCMKVYRDKRGRVEEFWKKSGK